ncbi:MAG: FoF1 ATP synthase subunit a [Porcincola intestinalis]|uniref:F0F1 ATP synthase subunit A n=1 Tax=Porcincola intestinalis TaxID=2606632 RepID=UPI002A90CB40|nr:FoF1 ATP synthase subunit a [Porcincola intestinalis]MDY5331294.1 FoF1 ATP synthase subunit a [Porcincola intestinalis]
MNINLHGSWYVTILENTSVGDIHITMTMIMGWVVLIVMSLLCWILGRNLKVTGISKRQAVAEWIVEALNDFVSSNLGSSVEHYAPFIGALFGTAIFSNLISLVGGVWSPTADLATEIGWGAIAFVLITKHKIKASGLGGYLKSYLSPIFLMAPINVISELATPVSMACRHFGNILSGMVIGTLIYSSLGLASRAVLGLIPGIGGWLGQHIPIFEIGLPAITSLYFDWFSGLIQPFIFCILTCIFIKQADEG